MMVEWIAFDADDTLWKNEEYYLEGRRIFQEIMASYRINKNFQPHMDELESDNIYYYGYGVMSFVLSLIEMGIKATEGAIRAEDIQTLLDLSKDMLSTEVELLPGVEETIVSIYGKVPLMLITKGDLLHQQRKVAQSGLKRYFEIVEVVSEKNFTIYQEILNKHQISPDQFLMVGNSLRSDIIPVLDVGGWAVYLTDHLSWSHEDGKLANIPDDRFMEISRIDEVCSVINRFLD